MPNWTKLNRQPAPYPGAGVATPGFVHQGGGGIRIILNEVGGGTHYVYRVWTDPDTGAMTILDQRGFTGTAPLACMITPDGRLLGVVRGATVGIEWLSMSPDENFAVVGFTALEGATTPTGLVFRGDLIYTIERGSGSDSWLNVHDYEGNLISSTLCEESKYWDGYQRTEDLSDHGYLLAFSDTQASELHFIHPGEPEYDVSRMIGGGYSESAFVWIATTDDLAGIRAKSGVVGTLNDNSYTIENHRIDDDDLLVLKHRATFDQDVGTQLDHNSQVPEYAPDAPAAVYYAHPDADGTDFHWEISSDGNAGFKTAIGQDRALLVDNVDNSYNWRAGGYFKSTSGTVVLGLFAGYRDSNDFYFAYKLTNDTFVLARFAAGSYTLLQQSVGQAADWLDDVWNYMEIRRNGDMISLYVNGKGMCYRRDTQGGQLNYAEKVAFGQFVNNDTVTRVREFKVYAGQAIT